MANTVIAQLLFLEKVDPTKDITIYVNSPGGAVTATLAAISRTPPNTSASIELCRSASPSRAAQGVSVMRNDPCLKKTRIKSRGGCLAQVRLSDALVGILRISSQTKCIKGIIINHIISYFNNYHITKKNFTAGFYGNNVNPSPTPSPGGGSRTLS